MTDWVIRKSATDVDEPVLAEPRKGFFVRFMAALMESRRRQARREIAKHAHLLSNDSGPDPIMDFDSLPAAYDAESGLHA